MKRASILVLCVAAAALMASGASAAQPRATRGSAAPHGEPHAGPRGYSRVTEPKGWNARPATIDRSFYNHNYQAARSYHIGPYQPPAGWVDRHWAFGQILPRAYWASQYFLSDYWLFGLEVPPVGCEWVRDGDDAILVNTANGEVLQAEYGVFA